MRKENLKQPKPRIRGDEDSETKQGRQRLRVWHDMETTKNTCHGVETAKEHRLWHGMVR